MNDDLQEFIDYVRLRRAWLWREAYRLCRDWHEAEDLVQMTLCQVYGRWSELTTRDRLAAYTRRTLVLIYLSEHRRPRWRHEISQSQLPESGKPAATSTIEERLLLVAALNRLGSRQRTVVTLRFYADLSVEQTASAMGCSIGTVTSQTHRALHTLRRVLTN